MSKKPDYSIWVLFVLVSSITPIVFKYVFTVGLDQPIPSLLSLIDNGELLLISATISIATFGFWVIAEPSKAFEARRYWAFLPVVLNVLMSSILFAMISSEPSRSEEGLVVTSSGFAFVVAILSPIYLSRFTNGNR